MDLRRDSWIDSRIWRGFLDSKADLPIDSRKLR